MCLQVFVNACGVRYIVVICNIWLRARGCDGVLLWCFVCFVAVIICFHYSIFQLVMDHVEIVSIVCVGSGHYDARRYIGKSPSKLRSPLLGQLRPP